MNKLRKSLMSLALGELTAACVFLAVYLIYLDFGTASLLAILCLDFMLLQGAAYWLFRYRFIDREKRLAARKTLAFLRVADVLLLCIVMALIIVLAHDARDMIVGALILVFAVIEYINYYWVRLSYGKSGFNLAILFRTGLKPSSIRKLLKRK